MSYLCPNHYIPSTYGEMTRGDEKGRDGLTMDEREAERGRMLRENGKPEFTGALTLRGFNFTAETLSGYRCWYCGKLSPAGLKRQKDTLKVKA
jgi:hypothetical protein